MYGSQLICYIILQVSNIQNIDRPSNARATEDPKIEEPYPVPALKEHPNLLIQPMHIERLEDRTEVNTL